MSFSKSNRVDILIISPIKSFLSIGEAINFLIITVFSRYDKGTVIAIPPWSEVKKSSGKLLYASLNSSQSINISLSAIIFQRNSNFFSGS